jgi:hypothetical protein
MLLVARHTHMDGVPLCITRPHLFPSQTEGRSPLSLCLALHRNTYAKLLLSRGAAVTDEDVSGHTGSKAHHSYTSTKDARFGLQSESPTTTQVRMTRTAWAGAG